ncbi:MAG: HD domain-containing protein [Dehalococcoidia bacterium]
MSFTPGDRTAVAERELRCRLAEVCPPRLMEHMDRVVAVADELARRWGLDVALARYMAQAHDVVRHLSDEEWLARAAEYGIEPSEVERAAPVLLHGPVGAEDLRRRFGVSDPRVLHAVWWHTPGHPDYPPEAWAMFIADKVEPKKAKRWKALKKVHRDALDVGLEAAALRYVELRLKEGLREGYLLQPEMLVTRNALLARIGENLD